MNINEEMHQYGGQGQENIGHLSGSLVASPVVMETGTADSQQTILYSYLFNGCTFFFFLNQTSGANVESLIILVL